MPLPKPKNKEKKSDFVGRCISELTKSGEFKTQDQRIAVCYKQFEEAKASADIVVGFGEDEFIYSAQKTYMGKKRSDLKDSDFLFPDKRSFPIVSPQDVKDAINNFGRMSGNMSYEGFIKKLYNKAKSKGKEFVNAIPESTRNKYNLKASEDEYECEDCGYEGKKASKCPKCGSSNYKYNDDDENDDDLGNEEEISANLYIPKSFEYVNTAEIWFDESEVVELDINTYFKNENIQASEYQGRKVKLNKPFRTPGGPKKFAVYVKNPSGKVVIVRFGDPNMKIKKNIPARRKSFRARHNCDNPGPKYKARYWACKSW